MNPCHPRNLFFFWGCLLILMTTHNTFLLRLLRGIPDSSPNHHTHHISPKREMGAPTEQQMLDTSDHESVVVGRDRQSVKSLIFISSSLADHSVPPVPTYICSQRSSAHAPKKCSWNMDPLLNSASTMSESDSEIQLNSSTIIPTVTENLTALTSILCIQLSD